MMMTDPEVAFGHWSSAISTVAELDTLFLAGLVGAEEIIAVLNYVWNRYISSLFCKANHCRYIVELEFRPFKWARKQKVVNHGVDEETQMPNHCGQKHRPLV